MLWKVCKLTQFANPVSQHIKQYVTSAIRVRCNIFNQSYAVILKQIPRPLHFKRSPYGTIISCLSGAIAVKSLGFSSDLEEPKPFWRVSNAVNNNELSFVRTLWKHASEDIVEILCAILLAITSAIANVFIPLTTGTLINTLSEYFENHVGNFVAAISVPVSKLALLYIVQAASTFGYISILFHVGEKLATRLRSQLFSTILQMDIAFFDATRTGELVNRLTIDVQDFKSCFKSCLSQGIRCFTQLTGNLVSLFIISPYLTVSTAAVLGIVISGGRVFGILLKSISLKAQEKMENATIHAEECLSNIRTVRTFAAEEHETHKFEAQLQEASHLNHLLGVGIATFQALSNLVLNGIVLGTLCVGGSMVSNGDFTKGDLMSFLVASQMILKSMGQLTILSGQAIKGYTAGSRVFSYLQLRPNVPLHGENTRTVSAHSLMGNVRFDHVNFSYDSRPTQTVLNDLTLEIPAGKVVALCGKSGSGKTTIAALLERLYEPVSGSVRIDEADVRTLDPCWLRGKCIGYISQEPVLFCDTIMENIRYAYPDATDSQVIAAAKLANADEFITSFPDGYNTVVGERGLSISAGQKQRIAIARALIKNPPILILDEATSALDVESEKRVQAALEWAMKGRTVLLIAHRLSTVRRADKIAVVQNGSVVEEGTHDELMRRKGVYWNFVTSQDEHID